MSNFSTYSSTDSRDTVEKVLKYSGDSTDLIRRADVKREVVVFRLQSATTDYLIEDEKPVELSQAWDTLVFVEQGDSHSIKEARYDRMLELTDQIMDWATVVSPADISGNVYTITLTGATPTIELDGYLSTTLSFNSKIKIQ
jgi:uncharacterized beta-barrel protein YwiB (DUF1934 family)